MYKLFTVQEANNLIPVVNQKLSEMQGAIRDILALREAMQPMNALSLEAQQTAEEIKFLLGIVQQEKLELDGMGVHLQDVETGLVDFPSRLGAEVIYLCWEQGKDAVTHYHRLNQEVKARQPLPSESTGNVAAA